MVCPTTLAVETKFADRTAADGGYGLPPRTRRCRYQSPPRADARAADARTPCDLTRTRVTELRRTRVVTETLDSRSTHRVRRHSCRAEDSCRCSPTYERYLEDRSRWGFDTRRWSRLQSSHNARCRCPVQVAQTSPAFEHCSADELQVILLASHTPAQQSAALRHICPNASQPGAAFDPPAALLPLAPALPGTPASAPYVTLSSGVEPALPSASVAPPSSPAPASGGAVGEWCLLLQAVLDHTVNTTAATNAAASCSTSALPNTRESRSAFTLMVARPSLEVESVRWTTLFCAMFRALVCGGMTRRTLCRRASLQLTSSGSQRRAGTRTRRLT